MEFRRGWNWDQSTYISTSPAAFRSLISRGHCLSSTTICSVERRLRAGLPALIGERVVRFGLRTYCTG